jgi:hypothetical protein
MHKLPPSAAASDELIKRGLSFQIRDRVWVKKLNKVGVVQEVRRGCGDEIEDYLLRVAVDGNRLLSVLVSPLAVEKWI